METKRFNIGDKVVTIKDGALRKCVIIDRIPSDDPKIYFVEYKDGQTESVFCSDVAK